MSSVAARGIVRDAGSPGRVDGCDVCAGCLRTRKQHKPLTPAPVSQRLACAAAVLAACAGAGFRPHKHLDKDAAGNEHSDLRIIGGSKVLVRGLSALQRVCLPHAPWPRRPAGPPAARMSAPEDWIIYIYIWGCHRGVALRAHDG